MIQVGRSKGAVVIYLGAKIDAILVVRVAGIGG